ncbi:DUF4162 domain-containing protein, partial [Nocardia sp. JMUB6875]|uniref:ATP-binding protein DrrA1-3 family domain-containing protein n=1 Tax=Nocardia sp. JMUB6875 TaxID=3158170 RepID=UPI0034E8710D
VLSDGPVVAQGSAAGLTEAGPLRYRLVLGGDAEWLRGFGGVSVVEISGGTAIVELTDTTTDKVLSEALARGSVRELAELRPSVSDIYREAVA